jgi:diacylglycerol kinase
MAQQATLNPEGNLQRRKTMQKNSISRWQSLVHAVHGFKVVFQETNAKIHLGMAVLAIALGFAMQITRMEWVAICFAIASVIGAEALNTALEKVVNLASPDWHETARQAKDAAAAAVLIFSLGAACVGALIFLPKMLA